jgi:hypothetical protein
MKTIVALLLLSSVSFGQSIVTSGGRSSIVMSGRTPIVEEKPSTDLKLENEFLKSTIEELQKKKEEKPKERVVPTEKRREWYLVSEPWCSHCPAAKATFLAKGWPEKNVLTIAECERRFGFRPSHVPFEFGEPAHTIKNTTSSSTGDTFNAFRSRSRLPVVNTQWGRIDLETYQRNCNCSMCQGIRALQQQYRAGQYQPIKYTPDLPPGQQPTPDDVVKETVRLLNLTSFDIHADLGCGHDARICIEAVKQSGCRSIGVEIDPVAAANAKRAVEKEGLSDSIKIICGDALDFSPASYGVTAITAYLFPDLLEKLRPKFQQVEVAATPYHKVPGLDMTQYGDVWLYKSGLF